jgi:hypothetical protein
MSFDRHYGMPRLLRWTIRCFAAFMEVIFALALLDNQGGTFGLVGAGIAGLLILMGWLRAEASMPTTGIYESADGLRVVGLGMLGGTRTLQAISWDRIDHFETRRPSSHRVLVVGRDGRTVSMLGARQGALFAWGDGETRDTAGILNQRLHEWRTSRLPQ